MTEETERHLKSLEVPIAAATRVLAQHAYADVLRNVVVSGLIDQLLEHHDSIFLLVRAEKIGSAFALARTVFEGMYRGLWLNFCATNEQIQEY